MSRLLSLLFHDVYTEDPQESGFCGTGAERYKLSAAEFDRQIAGIAAVRSDAPILVTAGGRDEKFAVTVDDGGVSYSTIIADRLEERGWRGHCFVTTGAIGRSGFLDVDQIRDLHKRGHVIGSHSVTHPLRFSDCTWSEMLRQWRDSRSALTDVIGADVVVASIPGGAFSRRAVEAASEAGYSFLFTSEPELSVNTIAGCTVFGRFAVRAGCHADFSQRLARLDGTLRAAEWLTWRARQAVKSAWTLASRPAQLHMVR